MASQPDTAQRAVFVSALHSRTQGVDNRVLDLENATDTLVASDLVCAIAGDETARDTIRARHPNVSLSDTLPDAPKEPADVGAESNRQSARPSSTCGAMGVPPDRKVSAPSLEMIGRHAARRVDLPGPLKSTEFVPRGYESRRLVRRA
jgi:hypothetical protein